MLLMATLTTSSGSRPLQRKIKFWQAAGELGFTTPTAAMQLQHTHALKAALPRGRQRARALPRQKRVCLSLLSLQPRTAVHEAPHNCRFLFILHGCLRLTTFVVLEIYFGIPAQTHSALQLCHSEQNRRRVSSSPSASPKAAWPRAPLWVHFTASKGLSSFWGCLWTSGKELRQPTIKKNQVYVCLKYGQNKVRRLARCYA